MDSTHDHAWEVHEVKQIQQIWTLSQVREPTTLQAGRRHVVLVLVFNYIH